MRTTLRAVAAASCALSMLAAASASASASASTSTDSALASIAVADTYTMASGAKLTVSTSRTATLSQVVAATGTCANKISVDYPYRVGTDIVQRAQVTRCDNSFDYYSLTLFEKVGFIGVSRKNKSGPASYGQYTMSFNYRCAGHGTDSWNASISVREGGSGGKLRDSKSTPWVTITC